MITFTKGDLFESHADALVNTVNCVGVMGKGIALQFKERFPENFRLYDSDCLFREIQTGKMFFTQPTNPIIDVLSISQLSYKGVLPDDHHLPHSRQRRTRALEAWIFSSMG